MKRRAWFAQIKPLLWLTIVTSAFLTEQSTYTLDVVVTSEDDSGAGTLRQAIMDINSAVGTEPNTITFAQNVQTIKLLSQLPSINNQVTIDALSLHINCNQLSPVDNAVKFSNSITVTIDGRGIPTTGPIFLIGLLICADDVTLRGLRVANFSNVDDAQVAGIVTEGSNTIIECCEVTNLNGNYFDSGATVVGIQGATDTIIANCFVHNLGTINHSINASIASGSINGITLFKTARNCRVEALQSGNIIHSQAGIATLETGKCFGISDEQSLSQPCSPPRMRCECPIDCQGSDCILVENCVVNCCQSGSVVTSADAIVTIGDSLGITIINSLKHIVIQDSTVCDIYTGNATLTEGTSSLTINSTVGIASVTTLTSCIHNNTAFNVNRGSVKISGLNSNATLHQTRGILISSQQIVAENNSVSDVTCQPVITSGTCITVQDENSTLEPVCIGNFADTLTNLSSICSGIYLTAPTTQVCNNAVTNINLGKRVANGEDDLIISGNAAGIVVILSSSPNEALVEYNNVSTIFGAELIAAPSARGIFGGSGSNGIEIKAESRSLELTVQNNEVEQVCEQSIRTSNNVPHGYIFLTNILEKSVLRPPAQTVGLLVTSDQISNDNSSGITILNNSIKNIVGAAVPNKASNSGTIAIGIAVKPPTLGFENFKSLQSCLETQNTFEPSKIQSNTIQNVLAGTKNAAYGILVDATHASLQLIQNADPSAPLLFEIQDNIINNIKGLGLPEPITEAEVLSLEGCGTEEQDLVNFIGFPYQPTSGIYTIFGNCSTISNNTIATITEPNNSARGIATQASSDVAINNNTISKVNGYGIFVGGGAAGMEFVNDVSGLLTEAIFENFFVSVRNKIYSNSTFDNTKDGIKLGLINWNNYFEVSEDQCGGLEAPFFRNKEYLSLEIEEVPEDSVAIYGNHSQIKPQICKVKCNRDGTITIDYRLDSPEQPITKFAIQFFVNKNNSVPHGEHHINEIDDPQFIFQTDIHGHASRSITFIPLTKVSSGDIISAHVTVTTIGQSTSVDDKFKGDTSEFGVESDNNACPPFITTRPSTQNNKPGFASILGR